MEEIFEKLTSEYQKRMAAELKEKLPRLDDYYQTKFVLEVLGIGFMDGLKMCYGIFKAKNE